MGVALRPMPNMTEDTSFGTRLRGVTNYIIVRRFLESGPLAIKSSAIESRGVALFKTSKIIQKVHRSSENDRF